ncbi:GNAT family N-acetyltransferase [Enterococcus alcedinis]|uniref:N-acetyltransferase n=1 Tax=Enterococcus alcedinis TaxID=1274384 RepID=A0A917JI27_9ENTE|nr:GNAT family N-acetyltransferase [Enterococcus alcedinis]MBP2102841.1 ribosomal protein S18 acetylase RimI-like enzyme [Enterococcus alcedinis]GGI66497.1 N-acetyltransferase [Enterococcus alcedinis]
MQFNWRQTVSPEDWPLLLEADPSKSMIETYLKQSELLEVRQEGHLIGLLVLKQIEAGISEIMNLSVTPLFQTRGIGRQLIEQAIAHSKERNDQKIIVATGTTSVGPLLLYQKCGFRVEAVERDYFTKYYREKIIENDVYLQDRLLLSQEFKN